MKMIKVTKNKILSEGLSSLLYHFTSAEIIAQILEQDRLVATNTMANIADGGVKNRNKHFFISFQRTRSPKSGYAGNTYLDSFIEFDGQKLNTKYKGTAIDYWGLQSPKSAGEMGGNNELEDRIVIDEPFVPNIRRYIKSIHVTVLPFSSPKVYLKLEKYCNLLNIPVYFYGSKNDFDSGQNSTPKPFDKVMPTGRERLFVQTDDSYQKQLYAFLEDLVPFIIYGESANMKKLSALLPQMDLTQLYTSESLRNFEEKYITTGLDKADEPDFGKLGDNLNAAATKLQYYKGNPYIITFSRFLSRELRRYGAGNVRDWVINKMKFLSDKSAKDKAIIPDPKPIYNNEYQNTNVLPKPSLMKYIKNFLSEQLI